MQESQHTEFKRQWKDELLKWVCGFANAEGGVLMVGYEGVNEGVSEGVNEQEKILLELIGSSPGKRTPYYAEQMQTSRKNVERWLKPLRDNKHVEFKGSPRTGGYWLTD